MPAPDLGEGITSIAAIVDFINHINRWRHVSGLEPSPPAPSPPYVPLDHGPNAKSVHRGPRFVASGRRRAAGGSPRLPDEIAGNALIRVAGTDRRARRGRACPSWAWPSCRRPRCTPTLTVGAGDGTPTRSLTGWRPGNTTS